MIFNCWHCGSRINQRTRSCWDGGEKTDVPADWVGKCVLCDHHPFCDELCVAGYKYQSNRGTVFEKPHLSGEEKHFGEWKRQRKVGRVRPKRR